MKKRIFKVLASLVLIIIMLFGYIFLHNKYNFIIPCVFHKLTGLYCPGCGITRCIVSLIYGDIYKAFMYNQIVFILLPFLALYFIYCIYLYIFDKKDNIIRKIPNVVWILLIITLISFGIIRNLPYFSFLRP